MISSLEERLEKLRTVLCEEPSRFMLGSVEEPYNGEIADARLLRTEYADFLKICNGARFGAAIVFFGHDSFNDIPESISDRYYSIVPGGAKSWIHIGDEADEPLFLRQDTNELWKYFRYEPDCPKLLGTFSTYLDQLLSQRYRELDVCLGEGRDFWLQALELAGLAD